MLNITMDNNTARTKLLRVVFFVIALSLIFLFFPEVTFGQQNCVVSSPQHPFSAVVGVESSPFVIEGNCENFFQNDPNPPSYLSYGIWNRTDNEWIIGPVTQWMDQEGPYFSTAEYHTFSSTGNKVIEARVTWNASAAEHTVSPDVWTVNVVPQSVTVGLTSGPSNVCWGDNATYTANINWNAPAEYRFSLFSYQDGIIKTTGWRNLDASMSGGAASSNVSYQVDFSSMPKRDLYRIIVQARPIGSSSYDADGVDVVVEDCDPPENPTIEVKSVNPSSGAGITAIDGNLESGTTSYDITGQDFLAGTLRADELASNGNEFQYWTGCNNYSGRDCYIEADIVGGSILKTVVAYYAPDNGDNGNGNGAPSAQAVLQVGSIGANNIEIQHLREVILGPGGFTSYERAYDDNIAEGYWITTRSPQPQGLNPVGWNGPCIQIGGGGRSCRLPALSIGETVSVSVILEEPSPELNSVNLTPKNPDLREGDSITFSANVNGDNLSDIFYEFNCGNGQMSLIVSQSYQESYQCNYGEPGEYVVSVEVSSPDTTNVVRDSTAVKVKVDIFKFIRRIFIER